ncbi:MAG: hypothetical protein ABSD57_01445 [Verrucomicrobiota bacterium]
MDDAFNVLEFPEVALDSIGREGLLPVKIPAFDGIIPALRGGGYAHER